MVSGPGGGSDGNGDPIVAGSDGNGLGIEPGTGRSDDADGKDAEEMSEVENNKEQWLVFKDDAGLCRFFCTLVLATVRNRYSCRFKILEMVRTVGNDSSGHPSATSASYTD